MTRAEMATQASEAIDDISKSYKLKREDIIKALYDSTVRDMMAASAKKFAGRKPVVCYVERWPK